MDAYDLTIQRHDFLVKQIKKTNYKNLNVNEL